MDVQILREPPRTRPSLTPEQRAGYEALIVEARNSRPDLAFALTKHPDVLEDLIYEIHDELARGNRVSQAEIFAPDFVTIPMTISEFIADRNMVGDWYVENLFDCWKKEICEVIEKGTLEWVLCLQKDTPIPLLNGSVRTISELAADWEKARKPFYVYSYDARRNITVGRASQVRQTGVDRIYRVWLDDGSYVEANARHQFVTLNGCKRKVADLKPGDSLAPFYRAVSKSNYTPGYETVYCPGEQRYRLTHEISGEWKYGDFKLRGGRNVFHHKDFDKRNNAPDNVERARFDWHYEYHARHKQRLLDKNPAQREALRRRMSAVATDPQSALRRGHAEYIQTDAAKEIARQNLAKIVPDHDRAVANGTRVSREFWGSEAGAAERVVRSARMAASNRNPESIAKRVAAQRDSGHHAASGRRIANFNTTGHPCLRNDITVEAVQEIIRAGVYSAGAVAERLGCSQTRIRAVMASAGFSSWPAFRAAVLPGNHKVVRVEDTGREEPVFCMTVDREHNFAVLARNADGSIAGSGVISSNTGSIGAGKTSTAMLAQEYKLYVVTCMRNPCSFYSATSITFGMYSAMRYLAYDVGANMLILRLKESPYFRDVVGISEEDDDPKKTRVKVFNFPGNVRFLFGASHYHGMGQDVFGCIMDEVAFFEGQGAKKARDLYSSIRTRIASRFKSSAGLTPGIMCLCSSANYEGDFLDEHIKNSAIQDRIHVSRFALYDVKQFPGERFRVMVGDRVASSKLIDQVTQHADGSVDVKQIVPDADLPEGVFEAPRDARPHIEHVPVDFYTEFNDDLPQALKDIAGIAMSADSVFFPTMEKVDMSYDPTNPVVTPRTHPFAAEAISLAVTGMESGTSIEDVFKLPELFVEVDRFRRIYRPRIDPQRPRFFHIDLAETQCAAGIACVHFRGWRVVEQTDARTGNRSEVRLPVVYLDFALQIQPPKDMSEIDFEKILQFVFFLRDHGMTIGGVSFDQYQCFTKDTKISLLDGTEKSFGELEGQEEFWVYSIDDRGDVVPGRGHSCRKTGDQAPVFRVTLDNGESVRCTGGHLFMLRDGSYRRADQLTSGDSLMPLYRWYADHGSKKGAYEYHYNPRTKRRRLTHTHVFKHLNDGFRQQRFQDQTHVIHHKDLNSRNNSPVNLQLMEKRDHAKLHAAIAAATRQSWADRWLEPGFRARHAEWSSRSMQETWRARREEMYAHTMRAVELSCSPEARVKRSVSMRGNTNGNGTWPRTCRWCACDFIALKAAQKFCSPTCRAESRRVSHNAVCRSAYAAKKAANNHQVVSVEFCGFEDVYDITVDEFHNFALSAGVFVHNSHHSQQIFEKAQIPTKEISLDRTPAAYNYLKQLYNAGCMDAYDYQPLRKELFGLRRKITAAKIQIVKPDKGCFVGETRVPTLDGGCPQLRDLVGREVWVYSSRQDGRIVPGRARGRMTKMTTELVDVILDSGAAERCTRDHLWRLRDGSYKRADHLVPGVDRLMPIKRSWPFNHGYERTRDAFGRRELTHNLVYEAVSGGPVPKGFLVHHKNEVKTDNRPENLELLEKSQHSRYHTAKRHAEDQGYTASLIDGLNRFNNSDAGRRKHAMAIRRTTRLMSPDELSRRSRKRFGFFRSDITFERLVEVAVREKSESPNAAARALGCGRNVVMRVLRDAGVESWDAFVDGWNHRVRAVVPVVLDEPVEVFDLEVDDFHNFALSSGVFVHNSKDVSDAVGGAVYNLGTSEYLTETAREEPMELGRQEAAAATKRPVVPDVARGGADWVIAGTPGANKITGIY